MQTAAIAGGTPAAAASTGGHPLPGGLTTTEHKAALDHRLRKSLQEFDQRLAREQAQLQQQRETAEAAAGAGDNTAEDGGVGGSGATDGSESAGADRSGSGSKRGTGIAGTPDAASASASAGGTHTVLDRGGGPNNLPIPNDIPDGHDDDVVARQLREAAEKETDPQVRKRLWDEYRKYKEGQS
ncbi:MAG: hypothetical protein KGJ55_03270 [Gammaproteobacteria bacterium]|nr:hypothetical protein [Gammaproteobacteria bacterium]